MSSTLQAKVAALVLAAKLLVTLAAQAQEHVRWCRNWERVLLARLLSRRMAASR